MLIRGDLLDPGVLAESARRNFEVYGFYGISVFAETAEARWTDLAASRFAKVEWLVLFMAGDLVESGLELWDTGQAPHFDAVYERLPELVARMLGTAAPGRPEPSLRVRRWELMPLIDLRADLNAEDDEGRWWSLIADAVDPGAVRPGAVLVAGSERFWSVVRIDQVDADGQVHFVAVADDDPEAAALLARSA